MAEIERTRTRERGAIPETPYEIFIRSRREFLERQETGQVVVKPSDREFFITRQGRLMYHLNPEIHKDTPLQDWRVFSHDLKTHSGKHRHQGGLVIYVIIGQGYSVVDGERVDWQAGDLLLLPIKPGGVEHQHFNLNPGSDCRWIAFSYMPFFDHVGVRVHPDRSLAAVQGARLKIRLISGGHDNEDHIALGILLAGSIAAASHAASAQTAGGILQGQDHQPDHPERARRLVRPLCAAGRQPPRPLHSRPSVDHRAEHAGRRRHDGRELSHRASRPRTAP